MNFVETTFKAKAARIHSYAPVMRDVDEITGLQMRNPTCDIAIQLDGGGVKNVDRDWFGKTVPQVGGYLLEMEDGSLGYMPKALGDVLLPGVKEVPLVSTPLE